MAVERKRRTIITIDLLRLAREQLERGQTLKDIARLLSLSYTSVLNISNKILAGFSDSDIIKTKGRPKSNFLNIKALISTIISEDNSLTQQGVIEKLHLSGIFVKQSFVSKILNEMRITRKRLSLVPQERNTPRTLDARQSYAREIEHISMSKLVYLDETGFNLHTSQSYGYSPINTKAFITVPANRGQNISLMAAISINGVICFEMQDGAYNGDGFINFITAQLIPYFRSNPDHVLIMDNCRFHHRNDVLRLLNQHEIIFKFLPPYSPQLNPIEEFFSELKANYRSIRPLSSTHLEVRSRVYGLLQSRISSFVSGYERARNLLPNAIARHQFM